MPACYLCLGRSFVDDNALRMHRESKHAYACPRCSKVLNSQEALKQHTRDKHSFFECSHRDRTFPTDKGRDAHQEAKHPPRFECEHCDREFTTDEGRLAHQRDIHSPRFECRYCDCELSTEHGRNAHEETKHSAFECRHGCARTFKSREARQQHEDTKHSFKSNLCDTSFTESAALRQHEQTVPHFECSYCSAKFFATVHEKAHRVSCALNPANHVPRPPLGGRYQFGSLSSAPRPTETAAEESSPSSEGSELSASPSPSSQDGGEMFHSTSALSSTNANSEDAIVTRPGDCTLSLEPASGDAESIVSADENYHDVSQSHHVHFHCTPCFQFFDTEMGFRNHVCALHTAMPRPHCQVCYTQFDDESLLQEHLKGLEAFSCQFCLTRCCSDEMLQDHLVLSHPTCGKCGKSFADNLSLCVHVESDHPVVVCWDCDGVVVENNSLESHYAESSAHPTCDICGVSKRNSTDMADHVLHVHVASTQTQESGGGDINNEVSPSAEVQVPEVDGDGVAEPPLGELGPVPLPSSVDTDGPPSGPGGEPLSNSLQTESSLSSSSQPPVPRQVDQVDETTGDVSVEDVGQHRYASPSPTPSEHGSNTSRLQSPASKATVTATNNDTRPPSPISSGSAGSLSDLSSPTSSSSNSVVFVSADGIPEYIRDNRAVLVVTSAGSPSSGRTPLRLPSSSSLESLMVAGAREADEDGVRVDAQPPRTGGGTRTAYSVHCRICLRDPCENVTATMCGHIFCKRCITQAVIAASECPVCKNATLLYCLFKLDLSV